MFTILTDNIFKLWGFSLAKSALYLSDGTTASIASPYWKAPIHKLQQQGMWAILHCNCTTCIVNHIAFMAHTG